MKLSEVIAQLEQFPEKEFIGEIGESTPIILKNIGGTNLYAAYENGDKVKSTVSLKRIWKEIKQPVTWQEAIQAWADGEDVYSVNSNGEKTKYFGHYHWMESDGGIGITKGELKHCKWYID